MTKTKEIIKNSFYLSIEEREKDVPEYDYSEEQEKYLSAIKTRIQKAKTMRDKPHIEFDNMSYIQAWQMNEKLANVYLKALKNKNDTNFQSGTLRTKLLAFLSAFQTLNLEQEIDAYDKKDMLVQGLGEAVATIIKKTEEVEEDREKKMIRQYELLKQGTVFIEELWEERWESIKSEVKGKIGSMKADWTTKSKKMESKPVRTLIDGPSVYLGSMSEYLISKQPFIFTAKVMSRTEAESIYGDWDMWKFVPRDLRQLDANLDSGGATSGWKFFSDSEQDKVEIIKYQSIQNNEFQVFLNGIPMLPLGYPLTSISPDGSYTIIQQNLEPIRNSFSYGKSFVFKNKNLIAVLDEMMKMAVLKTQKSFAPPYINTGDRVISRSAFMPGSISRGISKGQLQPLSEHEAKGVTNSEFGMISEVKKFIDANTVSPTFTGQSEGGSNVTATQIMQLQKQSRMMMAMFTLAASLLEKKLTKKRLKLIIKYWFSPIDKSLDTARQTLTNSYRSISYKTNIDGEGQGIKIVMAKDQVPSSLEIAKQEKLLKRQYGVPVRISIIDAEMIKNVDYVWYVNINPKPDESGETSKIMFGTMVNQLLSLGMIPNMDYLQKRFAQVWGENPGKLFVPPAEQQAMEAEQQTLLNKQAKGGGGQSPMPASGNKTTSTEVKVPGSGSEPMPQGI